MNSRIFHSAWLLILVAGLGLCACSRKGGVNSVSKGDAGKTTRVERRNMSASVDSVGDLRPSVQVDVKAEISGRVKKIHSVISEPAAKNALVVELDDTDLLTEKSAAQTEIEGAKLLVSKTTLAADRAKQLVDSDLISQQDADNASLDAQISQNNLEKALKKLQSVEDKLAKTKIVAPLGGTVIGLPIIQGQVVLGGPSVSSGTLLLTIANLEEMLISTHINQVDVTRMKIDQEVEVSMDAFDKMKLKGKIFFIAPVATIKNNIKGFAVDVLVSSPDARIRPGMSANVKVPLAKVDDALSVPIEAVFRENEQRVVYRKSATGFDRCVVEIGLTTLDRAEIKSGVKEGDVISIVRPKEDEKKS